MQILKNNLNFTRQECITMKEQEEFLLKKKIPPVNNYPSNLKEYIFQRDKPNAKKMFLQSQPPPALSAM